MCADVTSANVVGYATVARPQQNFCSGSMFNNIGKEGITLADLKISGPAVSAKTAWRNCNIVFMQSGGTAKFDQNRKYWMDWEGKWRKLLAGGNINTDPVMTEDEIKAVVINPGEGVICNFANTAGKLTYAGGVITGANGVKEITIPRPQQNFVAINPCGSAINLGQIKISGPAVSAKTAWRNCNIVFMQSGGTAKFDQNRKYWMDWEGKWRKLLAGGNINTDPVMTEDEIKAVVINPGEGVICNFANASGAITFPTAL